MVNSTEISIRVKCTKSGYLRFILPTPTFESQSIFCHKKKLSGVYRLMNSNKFVRQSAIIILLCLSGTLPLFGQSSETKEFETKIFRSEIAKLYKKLRLPGISAAVVRDGRIIYRQREGFADLEKKTPIREDSIFPIASITKTFTGVMMMKYAEQKKISLDDYLLEYPFVSIKWSVTSISPEVKLKDVLSNTAEGEPGQNFVYNGLRFNFLYGVFERVSNQQTLPKAYAQELQKNIIEPLGLKSTLSGYPADASDPLYSRVVTPYLYKKDAGFTVDKGEMANRDSYPSSGLLADIDDLAIYTKSLDDNRLINAESYKQMTTPIKNRTGLVMPYALGWFSENYAGLKFDWAYGLGDSYSALLVRVPEKKLTFIMLCNSSMTAGSIRLGYGGLLQSPFAVSFIKNFLLNGKINSHEIDYDTDLQSLKKTFEKIENKNSDSIYIRELFAQALIDRYIETRFDENPDKSKQLIGLLNELNPAFFDQYNPALIYLLSDIHDQSLQNPTERAINAFKRSKHFHTEIINDIIRYYTETKQETKALEFYKRLADSQGFEERGAVINACAFLGKYYLAKSRKEGRKYYWRAIIYAKLAKYKDAFIENLIQEMNQSNP